MRCVCDGFGEHVFIYNNASVDVWHINSNVDWEMKSGIVHGSRRKIAYYMSFACKYIL